MILKLLYILSIYQNFVQSVRKYENKVKELKDELNYYQSKLDYCFKTVDAIQKTQQFWTDSSNDQIKRLKENSHENESLRLKLSNCNINFTNLTMTNQKLSEDLQSQSKQILELNNQRDLLNEQVANLTQKLNNQQEVINNQEAELTQKPSNQPLSSLVEIKAHKELEYSWNNDKLRVKHVGFNAKWRTLIVVSDPPIQSYSVRSNVRYLILKFR